MNIHEYPAKNILKEFGAPVPKGIVINNLEEIEKKSKRFKFKQFSDQGSNSCWWKGKSRWY